MKKLRKTPGDTKGVPPDPERPQGCERDKPESTPAIEQTPPRVMRIKELKYRSGLCRASIYNRMNPRARGFDPRFPKPIKLGSSVGWIESEFLVWLKALMDERK